MASPRRQQGTASVTRLSARDPRILAAFADAFPDSPAFCAWLTHMVVELHGGPDFAAILVRNLLRVRPAEFVGVPAESVDRLWVIDHVDGIQALNRNRFPASPGGVSTELLRWTMNLMVFGLSSGGEIGVPDDAHAMSDLTYMPRQTLPQSQTAKVRRAQMFMCADAMLQGVAFDPRPKPQAPVATSEENTAAEQSAPTTPAGKRRLTKKLRERAEAEERRVRSNQHMLRVELEKADFWVDGGFGEIAAASLARLQSQFPTSRAVQARRRRCVVDALNPPVIVQPSKLPPPIPSQDAAHQPHAMDVPDRPTRIRLLVRFRQGPIIVANFPDEIVTIGRDPQCGLHLPESSVSRHHARLERTARGRLRITDLGSTNGMSVGDIEVTAAEVGPDDLVRIGEYELWVVGLR